MSALLRLDGVEAGYGDLTAISEVSLEVRQGEAVALIGGNGAGKTTTLRAISGLLPVRAGRTFTVTLPAHSVTVITLNVERGGARKAG